MSDPRGSRPLRGATLAVAMLLAGCAGSSPPGLVGLAAPESVIQPAPTVPARDATFAFEPFVGTPGNTADQLSRRIGEVARTEGLTIIRRLGEPATYRVKGHLSAVGDSTASTIIYVFDVYDANGVRLHRFSGQETGAATSADPWGGVSGETLDLLARRTVLELKAWLSDGNS